MHEMPPIEPAPPAVETVGRRLANVRERIRAAGGSDDVAIVGVTKTFPVGHVEAAVAAGLRDLGENYGQELVAKAGEAAALGLAPRWHFIGGLQRNKVKGLAGRVWLWQTVDREALVDEIALRDAGARVLIQVNTTAETQKAGCDPGRAAALVETARDAGLEVRGLMTVGPTAPGGRGGDDPRPAFELLRDLAERCEVTELSMGMSADYELAVAAGSTMVRIGSALFGPRTARP